MNGGGRHARPSSGQRVASARFTHLTAIGESYMRRFVLGGRSSVEHSLGTRIVNYADDLVILCRKSTADEALQRLREIMGKLKLTVNEEKHDLQGAEGEFDFLGYTFGRMYQREPERPLANGHQRKAFRRMSRRSMS